MNNCKLLPQKTSVFNYYIMKPFMLINLKSFFHMFDGTNNCIQ